MPHSDLHKKKRRKNLILLAIIFAFCLAIYLMSMVKMAHSHGIPDKYKADRQSHQEEIDRLAEDYEEEGARHQEEIEAAEESWWYGEEQSDQAKEVQAVKEGKRLEWESYDDYKKRKKEFEERHQSEDSEK